MAGRHNWNVGLPWCDLSRITIGCCNSSTYVSKEFHTFIPACPGATGCGYATVFTAYECLTFHHRILTCQVWARACPGATASENSHILTCQVWARDYWSDGIKGFWEMGNSDIERFLLTVKSIKEYFPLKINIPIFHHSIAPCTRHEYQALLNSNIFTKL